MKKNKLIACGAALILALALIYFLFALTKAPTPPAVRVAPMKSAKLPPPAPGSSTPGPALKPENKIQVMADGAMDEVIKNTMKKVKSPTFIPPPKILSQITTLKAETTRDSLKHFFHDDMFEFPPILVEDMQEPAALPLDPKVGAIDWLKIMSSRRFLKLLDELGQMPKEQACALVDAQVKNLLETYAPLAEERLQYFHRVGKNNQTPFFSLDVSPDPKPTIDGCRRSILGLLWIAGNLKLKDVHATTLQVANMAVQQREQIVNNETFYSDKAMDQASKSAFLAHVSLYSRQILITGLLGTSGRVSDPEAFLKSHKLSLASRELTKYDSRVSWGDRRVGGYHYAPDFSGGKLTVLRVSNMDDQTFDTLLAELR